MGNIRSTASIMIFPLLLLGYALDDADGCQMSATLCRDDGKGKVHAFNLHSAVDRVVGAGLPANATVVSRASPLLRGLHEFTVRLEFVVGRVALAKPQCAHRYRPFRCV